MPRSTPRSEELLSALVRARLMLVFSPARRDAPESTASAAFRDPAHLLAEVLPWVDVVQIRIKLAGRDSGPSPAGALYEWTALALELAERQGRCLPVLVNDRVDVALALAARGCAGVHLGEDDCPPDVARALLGQGMLIGLSTHSASAVIAAQAQAVNYLGFGPVFESPTKGVRAAVGPAAAWVASQASALPLFPIGGIDAVNAAELAPLGRAAVSSGILGAADPAAAARAIAAALTPDERR